MNLQNGLTYLSCLEEHYDYDIMYILTLELINPGKIKLRLIHITGE